MAARKVLIADDVALIRTRIRDMVAHGGGTDFVVCGQAADGNQALSLFRDQQPDIVLLDISMPGGPDGLTCMRKMHAVDPDAKVIIITGLDDKAVLVHARAAGAATVIHKDELDTESLIMALRDVTASPSA